MSWGCWWQHKLMCYSILVITMLHLIILIILHLIMPIMIIICIYMIYYFRRWWWWWWWWWWCWCWWWWWWNHYQNDIYVICNINTVHLNTFDLNKSDLIPIFTEFIQTTLIQVPELMPVADECAHIFGIATPHCEKQTWNCQSLARLLINVSHLWLTDATGQILKMYTWQNICHGIDLLFLIHEIWSNADTKNSYVM